ncbi:MAG: molybdopterin biosynthesis protein, partial [Planctomycetota bacterium]|nr:molybdopterin biosynthesis protein [Planctomycetota bacterium]
ETVLYRGVRLTSRETGVLSAIGVPNVTVYRRPRVAIISTGDELIEPAEAMRPGLVYDSNAQILSDAVRELGAEPVKLGIVRDNVDQLREVLRQALETTDVVLLSGGTSKGSGDLSYRVVAELSDPGIVAHGVALKPGKPICLAVHGGTAVVILPGFPTSAIFTFHEFVAPVIRQLAGEPPLALSTTTARLAVKVHSEIGRTEYLLVGLVHADSEADDADQLVAYPMGKGSGSVTTFSRADGFVTIGRQDEIVEAGSRVDVQLLGRQIQVVDLVVIGSHCVGLDYLLSHMQEQGYQAKFMAVGSTAGLEAARRGECDIAGIHLLDQATGQYNRAYVTQQLTLLEGYGRQQGIVYRRGDRRFEGRTAAEAIAQAGRDPNCLMVNRNQGSGTRILIDRLLGDCRPAGYAVQSRSHNAVAAAVIQGRADWGVAIESVAVRNELGFLALQDEQFDFVVPKARQNRPAVAAFRTLLADPQIRQQLQDIGLRSGS